MKNCKHCQQQFQITETDFEFYKQIDVPEPTLCPDCRQQRRLTYRNERKLYKRKCDLTGKEIISIYSPDKPCKVYSQDKWWGDDWNATDFGRDFDFNKPFFEQFHSLSLVTPRPCIVNFSSENSEYTNHSAFNKNCYMCINTAWSEDLLYCTNYNLYNKNCVDCLSIQKCELCYFCVDVKNAYGSTYLHECIDCASCNFCYDCHSCQDCFMCWNLRRKQYCIENKQYSKEEYEKKLKELMPKTRKEFNKAVLHFKDLKAEKAIHKALVISQCDNCTGDHLHNNKNVKDSFFVFGSQDCSYCFDAGDMKNCLDAYEPFKGEIQYETHACNEGYRVIACSKSYTDSDIYYCQYCWNSDHLFGCFGLKRKSYCILNKQYSKQEYEKLVPRITEHMKKTGEWGEFFPAELSLFGYNETAAQDYYPLNKEQAVNLKWKDEDKKQYAAQTYSIPDLINDVPESILNEVLQCETCKKNFKIVLKELNFYKQRGIPIPTTCFDCRHYERMAFRNPRKLWKRNCAKCSAAIQTTYAPNRPEIVCCEKCYLGIIY